MLNAREILASALQVSPAELTDDAAIGVTERWDSLAHMNLMLALEAQLGQPLETEAMLALTSLADIETLLHQLVSE